MRTQVSLLLDHGHPEARFYPLSMVWVEAEIVTERQNRETVTQAVLTQAAVIGANSKKGAQAFDKLIKRLSSGI